MTNKIKKIIITLIIACVVLFTGCSDVSIDKGVNIDRKSRFVSLQIRYEITNGSYEVIEDTQTGIIYLSAVCSYDVSPLLKSDGTPYNYDEFMSEYNYAQGNNLK